jgi:hypothetical protein
MLLLATLLVPEKRLQHLEIAKYLISKKIPVDGGDVSGTTALSHSISTKPHMDTDFARIMYDAGANINTRNRCGAVPGIAISMIYSNNLENLQRSEKALKWYLSHGGNLDVAEGDGFTPRRLIERVQQSHRGTLMTKIVESEDRRRQNRKEHCCTLCGREEGSPARCGRCKKALYCTRQGRNCQRLDWPRHKKECKA